ncbi:MAG: C40 family peptidase [Sulfitobacter sp.]|jgi:cell wall-associated NlpC family hydrolase|uniref:C40 family peptidase n=1 Tax=unclassified Sulfitobacter TaxID=196795 RepID=UPI0007C33EC4|nr:MULTISPECIES: NlpC/P60 family protein [unclassified Sulfitobacter]KZX99176.1 NLP/P60 hydrolase [Sulfitobacter sp. HI0027]KZY00111.1 NLP/P60 hydrolase [Sulfitobacter sp. HI0021]KZZ00069.1 NLP/P60 hydrolase [Sulfitobacter sp. HI0076]
MSDPRLTPDPALASQSRAAQVAVPVADLCRRPVGPRDRQVLFGEQVRVLHEASGWAYVQSEKDGYCGHVLQSTLGTPRNASHRVCVPATHAYRNADLKSPDLLSLSFGSLVTVTGETENFAETPQGHIPKGHLAPRDQHHGNPASVAALFLGTPYLWGGNSRWGIDCSGLVQAALLACGIPCPGDSDQQESTVGGPVEGDYQRNDLLFWKGHVALVVDAKTMIHANAHAMAVSYENITDAIARIEAAGDGPVTAHRRPGV